MRSGYSLTKYVSRFVLICILFFLFLMQPRQISAKVFAKPVFENALKETKIGNFEKALNLWNEYLKYLPNDSAALSNRGNVRLALGDTKGAIKDQTKAIEIAPLESDPYLNRGIVEERLLHFDKAANDYKLALKNDEGNAFALYNLGNLTGKKGDWNKAKELFDKAILANPKFVMARASKALALYEIGDFSNAELDLRIVIRKYPMFADARAALCALLWRKGFVGEAESNWAAASGLDSRYRQQEWLVSVRGWPPRPVDDLMAFLSLESL